MKNWTLVILLSCVAVARASDTTLFYFTGGSGTPCEWKMTRLEDKKTIVLTQTNECPAAVLFNRKERVSYFYSEKQFYKLPWKRGAVASALPSLPKLVQTPSDYNDSSYSVQLMADPKTGKLVVQKLVSLNEKSKDGKDYLFGKMRFPASDFVVGMPSAAVQLTLTDNAWVMGEVKPTTSEACDTMGLGVFELKNAAHAISTSQLDGERSCLVAVENNCQIDDKMKKTLSVETWAKGLEIGYIKLPKEKTGIAFEIGNCDGKVCFGSQAFYCTNDCKEHQPLAVTKDNKPEQIIGGYWAKGDFLLASNINETVKGQYTGDIARVFKMPGLTPFFEVQTPAIYWLNDAELWQAYQ